LCHRAHVLAAPAHTGHRSRHASSHVRIHLIF
jgi:hypothetical protein